MQYPGTQRITGPGFAITVIRLPRKLSMPPTREITHLREVYASDFDSIAVEWRIASVFG